MVSGGTKDRNRYGGLQARPGVTQNYQGLFMNCGKIGEEVIKNMALSR